MGRGDNRQELAWGWVAKARDGSGGLECEGRGGDLVSAAELAMGRGELVGSVARLVCVVRQHCCGYARFRLQR